MPAPPLPDKPGRNNWIEKTGTGRLPSYIDRVARHILAKNPERGVSYAIASAVNRIKMWCHGATVSKSSGPETQHVHADTRARACAALAEWNAKRAQTKGKKLTEAGEALVGEGGLAPGLLSAVEQLLPHVEMSDEDAWSLGEESANRATIAEGLLLAIRGGVPSRAAQAATVLLEGRDASPREWRGAELRAALEEEVAVCRSIVEAVGYAAHPIRGEQGRFHGMHGVERAVRRRTLVPDKSSAAVEDEDRGSAEEQADGLDSGATAEPLAEAAATLKQREQSSPPAAREAAVAPSPVDEVDPMSVQPVDESDMLQRGVTKDMPKEHPVRMTTVQLQERLNALGHQVAQDGEFGPLTYEAVKAVQGKYGLEPTGKLDTQTVDVLRTPPERTVSEEKERQGRARASTRSADMRSTQSKLDKLGYELSGGVRAAVRQYQRDTGLKPTGKLDEQTMARLDGLGKKPKGGRDGSHAGVDSGGVGRRDRSGDGAGLAGREAPLKEAAVYTDVGPAPDYGKLTPGGGPPRGMMIDDDGDVDTRPPNLRESGPDSWERCGTCVFMDGKMRCERFDWKVDRDDLCDEFFTLTPPEQRHGYGLIDTELDRDEGLLEALVAERNEAADRGDGDTVVRVLAREQVVRDRIEEACAPSGGKKKKKKAKVIAEADSAVDTEMMALCKKFMAKGMPQAAAMRAAKRAKKSKKVMESTVPFAERLHPRGRGGKWIRKVGDLGVGDMFKDAEGNHWRVKRKTRFGGAHVANEKGGTAVFAHYHQATPVASITGKPDAGAGRHIPSFTPRLGKMDSGKADQGDGIEGRVGATSYRSDTPEHVAGKAGFHESQFGASFEAAAEELAHKHSVTIDHRERTQGFWTYEGKTDQEPSWMLDVHDGEEGVRAFEEDLRAKYNQDAVYAFRHDEENGDTVEVRIQFSDPAAAAQALKDTGIENATIGPNEIVLWGDYSEANKIASLRGRLGVSPSEMEWRVGSLIAAERP